MKGIPAGGLGLSLLLLVQGAWAQDCQWRPIAGREDLSSSRPAVSASSAPFVSLGRPVAVDSLADRQVSRTSFSDTPGQPVVRGQSPGGSWTMQPGPSLAIPYPGSYPTQSVTVLAPPVSSTPPPGAVPGPPPGPPPGGAAPPVFVDPIAPGPPMGGGNLFGQEWLGPMSTTQRGLFKSDHCFDNFISPVTNPSLFEDPRSLTELRVIGMYQATPESNLLYRAGDVEFFGIQARLALTERLSFVLNKAGFVWNEANNGMGIIDSHVGFSEINLGPKYTFLRNDQTNSLGAFGVTFQIPSGPAKVFQDTGNGSVVPYFSFGQNLGVLWGDLRNFNALTTAGYALGLDNQRTDYFYNSWHLDYDVGGLHRIYPLVELNWVHYTAAGKANAFGFEGRDLFNFGSTGVSGKDSLTMAFGTRVKLNTRAEFGVAAEFPLIASMDLINYRLTADFIIRY